MFGSFARTCALVLLLAIAGCEGRPDTSPGSGETVFYSIEDAEGVVIGSMEWTFLARQFRTLDRFGQERYAIASWYEMNLVGQPEPVLSGHFAVDWATKIDLVHIGGCERNSLLQCSSASFEWPQVGASTLFGSSLLWYVEEVDETRMRLRLGESQREFMLYRVGGSAAGLSPIRTDQQNRVSEFCNLLDDETLIDLSRHLVLECRGEKSMGVSYHIRDAAAAPAFLQSRPESLAMGNDTAFGQLKPRDGPLPPGSDAAFPGFSFTLKEAHDEAQRRSVGLRDFLESHPEAAFEDAGVTELSNGSSAGALRTEGVTYRLRYLAANSIGYEVVIRKEVASSSGVIISSEHRIEGETEKPPGPTHRWKSMRPLPRNLTSIRDAAMGVSSIMGGVLPSRVTIVNTADASAGQPRYSYFFSLGDCMARKGPNNGTTLAFHVEVDSFAAALRSARIGGDCLGKIVWG